MDSPSTKRAYAATLAASLGVANQEVILFGGMEGGGCVFVLPEGWRI